MKHAYVYMIRCEGGSLYTGIAADLYKRLLQHYRQDRECAKYTRAHRMERLELAFRAQDLKQAARLEYRLKQLRKPQKEALLKARSLRGLLAEKIELIGFEVLSCEEIDRINQALIESGREA